LFPNLNIKELLNHLTQEPTSKEILKEPTNATSNQDNREIDLNKLKEDDQDKFKILNVRIC